MIPEEIYKFLVQKNIRITSAAEEYIVRSALRIIESSRMWEHLPPLRDRKVREDYLSPLCSILLLRAAEISVSINLYKEISEGIFIRPLEITVRDAQVSALTSQCTCMDTGDPETHWPKNDLRYVVCFSGELFRLIKLLTRIGIEPTSIGLLKAIDEYKIEGMMEMKYDGENKFGPTSLKLKNWFKIKMEIWYKIAEIIKRYEYFWKYDIERIREKWLKIAEIIGKYE
jgi:hypothetical protein